MGIILEPKFEKKGIRQRLYNIMLDWYFTKKKEKVWLGTAFNTRVEIFYIEKRVGQRLEFMIKMKTNLK